MSRRQGAISWLPRPPSANNRIKVSDGVKDRPTLEIDPVAAPIVKEIFESSRRGNGLKEICKELNGRGITNRGQAVAEEHRPLPARPTKPTPEPPFGG